jgi:hypothetical protein
MLRTLVAYLEAHTKAAIAFSSIRWVDDHDEPIFEGDPRLPSFLPTRFAPAAFGLRRLHDHEPRTPFATIFAAWAGIVPSNALLRRSAYAMTRGWDESLGQPAEDTDLFLSMALFGEVHYIPTPLVRYRRHRLQSTADRARILVQDRKLFEKWEQARQLAPAQQEQVRSARRFREMRVLPYIWLTYGGSHMRSGHLLEGVKCLGRALKQYVCGVRHWHYATAEPK